MKKPSKIVSPKSKNLFSWLKEITWDKRPWSSFNEHDTKEFNSYLVHRYLSMYEPCIEIVNEAQLLPHADKEKIYQFYCELIPRKQLFLKYIKNNTKNSTSEELTKNISEYYTCSIKEAGEYLELLDKEEIIIILKQLAISDKEIKKLTK